jgi:hypothetical protein
MKRFALLACLALGVIGAPNFAHAAIHTYTGTVLIGDPIEGVSAIYSEAIGLCADDSLEGVDGDMVKIDPADAGRPATLKATAGATGLEDFDANFFDAECNLIGDGWFNDGDEAGNIPEGAEYVDVYLFLGAQAEFTLAVS